LCAVNAPAGFASHLLGARGQLTESIPQRPFQLLDAIGCGVTRCDHKIDALVIRHALGVWAA
jgi:hypothetical protein